MNIILDTETSGLPKGCGYNRYPDYQNLDAYDTARIVSISWIVVKGHDVVQQSYYVVKPDGFVIGDESIKIHGITNEYAQEHGLPIRQILKELLDWVDCCTGIVAHNINFDKNVILSEMHRYGYSNEIVKMKDKHFICTMKKGKEFMDYHKNPRLEELYMHLYNEPIVNAHNAEADTYYCYKCFIKMFPTDKNIFFFQNREVKLTDEQREVVFHDRNTHMMVIACAGSGKTISSLCRIKHLIDSGVPEQSIMLTTFTKDAADDMKNKLVDILGYVPAMAISTIDSISRSYVMKYCGNTDVKQVGEFGHDFLKLILKQPSLISHVKYLFVDEFQDINDLQYNIIREFYNNGSIIFGVGDDAQNIYTFRGSNITYIMNFEQLFGGPDKKTKSFKFTHNFRSSQAIIDLANASIEKNVHQIPKKMVAANTALSKMPLPIVHYTANSSVQNESVIKAIIELQRSGVNLHNIAILCSMTRPLYMMEELLTKQGVKNVYLDGRGDVRTSRKSGHVCLSTIHKSKGLEWDHVFLISMSDDVIPKNKATYLTIEEDRRLFYVGVTRAKRQLSILFHKTSVGAFVTRFISEIPMVLYDFINWKSEYFDKSAIETMSIKKTVTKLIELMDGEDYIKLKEMGIIPTLDTASIKRTPLYDASIYKGAIKSEDLYMDFGIFIDTLITREASKMFGLTSSKYDKYTMLALAHVTVDRLEYEVYRKYKRNFDENIGMITSVPDAASLKKVLERNGGNTIAGTHLYTLVSLVSKMLANSKKFKIPIDKIPIFTEQFLPNCFIRQMEDSMNRMSDWSLDYKTVINEIWDVSKSQLIVNDRRRRLLFKELQGEDIMKDYEMMMDDICDKFLTFVKGLDKPVVCRLDVKNADCVQGEIDMIVGDTIIDYKVSNSDDVDASWILQLLCYKALYRSKEPINKIAIFNALKGWYAEIDVSTWAHNKELIAYLLEKRETKLKNQAA
jgi:DNA polymerase III epsilon subunit-like protein